jgi:uncharacterized protein (TIGR02646 family)
MKYINLNELTLPEGWLQQAEAAMAEIRDAQPEARTALINKHAALWGALKESLARLSDQKCWYCESRQIRSDNAVDHFRPKGSVFEDPTHSGYWWLVLVPGNLRFSCTFCNSRRRDIETGDVGGKQDRFPLLDEALRVRVQDGPIEQESPHLLDPSVVADPPLLFFENDGRVVPALDSSDDQGKYDRAAISIDLYHLNHTRLKRARKRLFSTIKENVEAGDVFFRPGPEDDRVQYGREAMVKKMQTFMSGEHQYWAAAQEYMRGFASQELRPWLFTVLSD